LKTFLLAKGFKMKSVNKALFVLNHGNDSLLVQIYMDDIIFGGSSYALVYKFSNTISREFEMSMMRSHLLPWVENQVEPRCVHQDKYTKDVLEKYDMSEAKLLSMPMSTTSALDADEDSEPVD
jgi:hypothetical protein